MIFLFLIENIWLGYNSFALQIRKLSQKEMKHLGQGQTAKTGLESGFLPESVCLSTIITKHSGSRVS